jgi:putative beta-barrel porin
LKSNLLVLMLLALCIVRSGEVKGQSGAMNRLRGMGGGMSGGGGSGDSLLKRVDDSITISFRYLDSSRSQRFDTVLTDFNRFFPVPWQYKTLGNLGNAAESMVFSPNMKPGWDPGFHAFDIYNLRANDVRFYNTTNAYSELGYLLGSRLEQMIHLLHTQNLRPNWNLSFQYRLINSPGFFQNQATNHNSYRFGSWYQSLNKRYQNFVVLVGNKLQSGENGGIRNDGNYLDSLGYTERLTIPTKLGGDNTANSNFFNPVLNVASRFTSATYMLRQQYDFGQKDSIVTDTSVVPLFYPRIRLEHTITYNTYKYRFEDNRVDSGYYKDNYNIPDLRTDSSRILLRDVWSEMINDFSVYSFPDAKNSQQFLKLGVSLQNLTGTFDTGRVKNKYDNLFLHGEYRNKTRNQKWDIEAYGRFYGSGYNAGDYNVYASLKRFISRRIGYLQVGFQNVNRTPSFNFDAASSFYIAIPPVSFNKENTTNIFASLEEPLSKLKLTGSYYLVSNYMYYEKFYVPAQASALFNVLSITAQRQFRLGGKWNWRTWVVLQQKAGNAPVNLPLILTRNQVGYDGNLGFKNLNTSFGLEFRYFTPYKANDYSPMLGQFVYQDTTTVRMRLPEIGAFLHFRIRSFTAYLHAENLNSFSLSSGGFKNNNILVPGYPTPGLQIRLGILWSFIN